MTYSSPQAKLLKTKQAELNSEDSSSTKDDLRLKSFWMKVVLILDFLN